MDELLEDCGIEELYPEYSRLPQVNIPEDYERELMAKYPSIEVQFFGVDGERVVGEAIDRETGTYIVRMLRGTTFREVKELLDKELAEARRGILK